MEFTRYFYNESRKPTQAEVINSFKSSKEYKQMLPEIETGKIFPALGKKNILRFYDRGALLGTFNSNGYRWHDSSKDYHEARLKCEAYKPEGERDTLSRLCERFSPYIPHSKDFILLDIEIGFPKLDLYHQIQIDLLFLDKDTMTLYFVEGKEASDNRIKVTPSDTETIEQRYNRLEVREQIEKYQINITERKQEILTAYNSYLKIMSSLFSADFPKGSLSIYPKPKLLIYGASNQYGLCCKEAIRESLKDGLVVCESLEDLSANHLIADQW